MTLRFKDEKNIRAAELGWPDGYEQAIYDLYVLEEISYRQVAAWFGVCNFAINARIKKIAPDMISRPRGGNHGKPRKLPKKAKHPGKTKKITCQDCQSVFERGINSRAFRCAPCQTAHEREVNRAYQKGLTIPGQAVNEIEYHMSLGDIAAVENVSRERVRQIQDAALQKIRKRFPELRELII